MNEHLQPGSLWVHKNGKEYVVVYLANEDMPEQDREEYPLMVIYHEFPKGKIYAKTPEGFLRSRTLITQ